MNNCNLKLIIFIQDQAKIILIFHVYLYSVSLVKLWKNKRYYFIILKKYSFMYSEKNYM